MIEKQIARHFAQYSECFSTPLPFYTTLIITTFVSLRISANHDNEKGFSQYWNPYTPYSCSSVEYHLTCLMSWLKISLSKCCSFGVLQLHSFKHVVCLFLTEISFMMHIFQKVKGHWIWEKVTFNTVWPYQNL